MKLVLTYVGRDSWSRPVYQCGETLYVDTDPREGWPLELRTKTGNQFDSEPDFLIPEGTEVEFVPARDTW